MATQKKIFLSYSQADKQIAQLILKRLEEKNIPIRNDYSSIKLGSNYFTDLSYSIEPSDIVVILLSNNFFESKFNKFELEKFLNDTRKRKVSIIPIIVGKTDIPYVLLDYEILNFSNNLEKGIEKLIEKLNLIPEITFESFTSQLFEDFIFDLLKEYGFRNITQERYANNFSIDYTAEFISTNPFGIKKKETWLIETKFYREERFSVSSIKQLFGYKKNLLPSDSKLLLITNSILTSVAEEYLRDIQKFENTQIEIIDGLALKKLVSKRKKLLKKYFLK